MPRFEVGGRALALKNIASALTPLITYSRGWDYPTPWRRNTSWYIRALKLVKNKHAHDANTPTQKTSERCVRKHRRTIRIHRTLFISSFSDVFLASLTYLHKASVVPLIVLVPHRSRSSVDLRPADASRRSVKNLIGLRAVPRLGLDQEEEGIVHNPLFPATPPLSPSLSLFVLVTLFSPRPRDRRSIPGGDVLREHTLVEKSGRSVALITNNDDGRGVCTYMRRPTRDGTFFRLSGTSWRSHTRTLVLHERMNTCHVSERTT